jgi:hypothetical protein
VGTAHAVDRARSVRREGTGRRAIRHDASQRSEAAGKIDVDDGRGTWKQRLREGIAIPASNKRARSAALSTGSDRLDVNRATAQQLLDGPIAQGIQRVHEVLHEQGMTVASERVAAVDRDDRIGVVVTLEGHDEAHPIVLHIVVHCDRDPLHARLSTPGSPSKALPFPEHADEITEESVARSIADAYLEALHPPAE